MAELGGLSIGGRNLEQALIIINTSPILDNSRIGPYVYCAARVFASANTNTVFPHILGRVPNGYVMYRTPGGLVYDASTGITAWTLNSITLRATVAGTYSFWLL
jgi:hypothetical protein